MANLLVTALPVVGDSRSFYKGLAFPVWNHEPLLNEDPQDPLRIEAWHVVVAVDRDAGIVVSRPWCWYDCIWTRLVRVARRVGWWTLLFWLRTVHRYYCWRAGVPTIMEIEGAPSEH